MFIIDFIKRIKLKIAFKKSLKVFLSFLVFGVALGLAENLIAIHFATDYQINARAIIISLLVVIPFAAIGEVIVDHTNFLPRFSNKYLRRLEVFFEFMVFGIIMGVVEDLIVIGILTGEPITWKIIGIVALVTLPFAILGELIVDREDWFAFIKTKKIENI